MTIEAYLKFNGRSDEAIEFYTRTLGASVSMLMRFKDSPDQEFIPPGAEEKVMHASLEVRGSTVMVSDGMCQGEPNFDGFALSIQAHDVEEGQRLFNALAEGGEVSMPFGKTFWSPGFGMLKDRLGVPWMINVGE